MSTLHVVYGKPTTHGHIVHYRDSEGTTHAAIITNIIMPPTGEHRVDLHVFHRVTGESNNTFQGVPHSIDGEPHTWQHLPY
jgi:hypothetical protein